MESILDIVMMVLRVILAGLFALTPGMLVWVSVLGVFLLVRRLLSEPQQGQAKPA
jgi:hypothetical protein